MDNPVLTEWLVLPGNLAAELAAVRARGFPKHAKRTRRRPGGNRIVHLSRVGAAPIWKVGSFSY